MKNIYKIFILVLLPFVGFGQNITLSGDAKISVKKSSLDLGSNGTMNISGGNNLKIYKFGKVTAGDITCDNLTGIKIYSYKGGDGSLICTGSPKATVKRKTISDEWNQLSPPIASVKSEFFYSSVLNKDSWLVKFNESKGAKGEWEYITSLSETISAGEGRSFYRKSDKTLNFKGIINTSNVSPILIWTDASHGYNLIGNPFTSNLLWDGSTDWALNSVDNAIWIWDGSQYITHPGSLSNPNIAMSQGFFVKATASGASITIPKSKRNHGEVAFSKKDKNSGRNYVIINADNNGNKDVAYIYFDATGSEGYDDGYDATKMIGSDDAPQLYTLQNGMDLTYNFLPTLDSGSDKIIPLSYIPGASGNQKLTFDLSNLSGATIFIEDLITGDIQNLASNNEYSFTGSKDDTKDRFSLRFSANGSLSDVDEVVSKINIFSTGNVINIKSTNKAIEQSGTVYIYDISGREILRKEIGDTEIMQIPISSTKGSIIVKVEKGEFSKVEKLIIK